MRDSTWWPRYLGIAKEVSTWSKDPSTQVGAVVVGSKGQILAQGYNGYPRGMDDSDYTDREAKYTKIVHAEMNALMNALYSGVSLKDSTIYVYGLPVCNECAKGIIQSGILRVVGPKNGFDDASEKWKVHAIDTQKMFKESGVIYDFI